MTMRPFHLLAAIAALGLASAYVTSGLVETQSNLLFNPKFTVRGSSNASTLPIALTPYLNSLSTSPSFSPSGAYFPSTPPLPHGITYGGINFTFPGPAPATSDTTPGASAADNVLAAAQYIPVPAAPYHSVHILAASAALNTASSANLTVSYTKGPNTTVPLRVPAAWNWPYPLGGDVIWLNGRGVNGYADGNASMLYLSSGWVDSGRDVVGITLPAASEESGGGVHIFAMSLVEAEEKEGKVEVMYARSTNVWLETGERVQVCEVTVGNLGREWVEGEGVSVVVESEGVETVVPGRINRLAPGDQVIVQVGVRNKPGVAEGTPGTGTVHLTNGSTSSAPYTFDAVFGVTPYSADYSSIYTHESPPWYNDAKYGIFIHWGVYSVPGWGNVGASETYAEWYWWHMNKGPDTTDRTYQYHLETYGEDVVYDDFIANFTADAFDPRGWVDLFADAGAKYFVQVSKHHDGYALFDLPENVSKRTSVSLSPHRNLLKELFDAAETYQPGLHKAAYYSLPEWFHPDYKSIGFDQWPGGSALNPYTNDTLSYTGYVPVQDYVRDLILPEMQTLADMGVEIMWCDIGGPNATAEFAAKWFNDQAQRGKQVLMDNRCGLPGDFDTPEYARYDAVQTRKWESNLGMDPFSYGYNRATPLAEYMNATTIVHSLVDIVSKNGNFLLDVGPMANGTILPVQANNLREAGLWIHGHEEAIFGTSYWFVTPQQGDSIRFTTTPDAFYVLLLEAPQEKVLLDSRIPWLEGDQVVAVGGKMNGTAVESRRLEDGSVELALGTKIAAADKFAWVFKIPYAQ